MNTVARDLPNREQDQQENVRQEPKPVSENPLVELGKVSDTQGGWLGPKIDSGMGFIPY